MTTSRCKPYRVRSGGSPVQDGEAYSFAVAVRHSRIARQASRACSGRSVGAFHKAITASPMYLSMVPPQERIASVIVSMYKPSDRASSYGRSWLELGDKRLYSA